MVAVYYAEYRSGESKTTTKKKQKQIKITPLRCFVAIKIGMQSDWPDGTAILRFIYAENYFGFVCLLLLLLFLARLR